MKLTMSSELGIHAIWYLATEGSKNPMLSSQIAAAISSSETYLIKVLKRMVKARLLASRKGKHGGYMMRQEASAVSLAQVIQACEGDDPVYACLREDRGCTGDQAMCPICNTLHRAQRAFFAELQQTTLQDLINFGWPVGNCSLPFGSTQDAMDNGRLEDARVGKHP